MSSLDLTRDWLQNVLRAYPSKDVIIPQVLSILQTRRSLAVKTDAFSEATYSIRCSELTGSFRYGPDSSTPAASWNAADILPRSDIPHPRAHLDSA